MGQTTDQIEDHIEGKREDLKSNFQELESRVKSATDWRTYFREHSGAALAVAFGGGLLISALMSKGSSTSSPSVTAALGSGPVRGAKHQVVRNFDTITTALVGAAATKFKNVLSEVVPGFAEHVAQVESDRPREPTH
jgi:hypothetical protein